jgi:signal transduction histidine kinase
MSSSQLQQLLKKHGITLEDTDLFNALSHEVFIVNRSYDIVYANDKKKSIYGHDIVGKKCYEVFPQIRSRNTPCLLCACASLFADSTRDSSRNELFQTVDKDGNLRYISETAVPLKNRQGEIALSLVLGRDITKRVKLESIKKDFYGTLGSEYNKHLEFVVSRLNELGYARIRIYDVITDSLSPKNPLFVLRAKAGSTKIDLGYSFHMLDDGYREVLAKLVNPDEALGADPSPELLTEAMLLRDGEFASNNRCVNDLGLQGIGWILFPLLSQSKLQEIPSMPGAQKKMLIGLLSIDNGDNPSVTSDDLLLLRTFADFFGEAITAIRAEMNLHILNNISQLFTHNRVSSETQDLIAKEVCQRMQAGMCSIFIYSETRQKLERFANYISSEIIPEGDYGPEFREEYDRDSQHLTSKAFAQGTSMNIISFKQLRDASSQSIDARIKGIGEVHWNYVTSYEDYIVKKIGRVFEIKNAIFAPLKFEDHHIGVIRIVNNYRDGRFPFPDSDVELLNSIALQIAAYLYYEGLKADVENAISEMSRSVAEQKFDLQMIAENVVTTIQGMSKAYAVTLFLITQGGRTLKSVAKKGYPSAFEGELEYALDAGATEEGIGITAKVAMTGVAFEASRREEIIREKSHSGKYKKQLYGDRNCESMIALPMRIGQDIIGVLKVEDPEPRKFGRSFRIMFDIMADLASLAIRSVQEIERRRDLIIGLGHELAIPAVALSSMGLVMRRRYSKQEELLQHEERLVVNKAKLFDYCNELAAEGAHLVFLTSGREALDPYAEYRFETDSLREVLWEVTDILRVQAKWKDIGIDFPARLPQAIIMMDRNKLKQAIYNLIYNAIKYSNRDGMIYIDLEVMKRFVTTKIQDEGIGVPEGDEKKIFDRGVRGNNAIEKDPTGLGLGLYYTQLIIKGHHGHIYLTSRHNPTEFTITLPIEQKREE